MTIHRTALRGHCASWALAAMLLFAGLPAGAEMRIDRAILVFEPDGAPRQDVEVTNAGEEMLYLDTEVLLVTDPGTEAEARTPLTDPDAATLLVTPARAVIPPGGRQLLRVLLLEDPAPTDRIFRVNVRPVSPPLEAEQTAVKVLVAYQLLVIQRPLDAQPDLRAERDGRRITFENRGNTNVLLFNGRQCPTPEAEAECVDVAGARRLYAGNRWETELPLDAPVEYTLGIGESNVRRRFD